MKYAILAFILLSGCQTPVYAQVNAPKAILAVIGEAEAEGYRGMLAVACAIRNRGTLKGVYGLKSPRVRNHLYSAHTYALASAAWKESGNHDITEGATGWGNESDLNKFCSTTWWHKCQITAYYGHQWFYKEIK